MLTGILIGALALIAFLYVALPLLVPDQADPLPDDRDPVLVDLTEEREALFRAIRELDAREDLPAERRRQLHERYEVKAAKVLTAIDAREAELRSRRARWAASRVTAQAAAAGTENDAAPAATFTSAAESASAAARPKRRVPFGAVAVLGVLIAIAALVPSYVLPRVGQESTITTTDIDVARQLQAQRRAVEQDPSVTNLLALGDTYMGLQQLDEAEATYLRAVDGGEPAPAAIYQRLAVINLQRDLGEAQRWLQLARDADPNDPDTLFLLGEVAWAQGDLAVARSAYTDFVAAAGDLADPQVEQRVELLERVVPLLEAVEAEPSVDNLMALGDAFWQAGEPQRAVESYFRVLTDHDSMNPVALGRTGQLLYLAGRPDDAIGALERAATAAGGRAAMEPDSLRVLADAYLQVENWSAAEGAYRSYVDLVGEAQAGNAPELLEAAAARARGEVGDARTADAITQVEGQQVFVTTCAQCHGPRGEGGMGARLAGSSRAANRANVEDAVRFGRGMMPAFQAQLEPEQLDAVVAYVTEVLAVQP